MSDQGDVFRLATRDEFDFAIELAAAEGWNPGLDDADIFWETDPEGFVCVERSGEVIATGSIVSYGTFGFMGFFIVKPELRGKGIGRRFWHWRKERLLERLDGDGVIGMDGVFDMQPFYAKGGFEFSHRNLRMEGVATSGAINAQVVELSAVPFEEIEAYDLCCFGFPRSPFLRRWIAPKQGHALAVREGEALKGFGVIRKCRIGHKIGPLFADDPESAAVLFAALSDRVAGDAIFLDTPECNESALSLARNNGMIEVFGCARMYCGPFPDTPWDKVYGVTTFELG